MITTQSHLDSLASRIERAYKLKHPRWAATGVTHGVWTAAAARLNGVVLEDPDLPVDPELFVAVQDYGSFRRDPWCELTQEGALRTYRSSVRRIINQLKRELKLELRWSRRVLAAGRSLDEVLNSSRTRLSPIGKLMLCYQHQKNEVPAGIRSAAEAQHLACPLYRFVCKKLITRLNVADQEVESMTLAHSAAHEFSHVWN